MELLGRVRPRTSMAPLEEVMELGAVRRTEEVESRSRLRRAMDLVPLYKFRQMTPSLRDRVAYDIRKIEQNNITIAVVSFAGAAAATFGVLDLTRFFDAKTPQDVVLQVLIFGGWAYRSIVDMIKNDFSESAKEKRIRKLYVSASFQRNIAKRGTDGEKVALVLSKHVTDEALLIMSADRAFKQRLRKRMHAAHMQAASHEQELAKDRTHIQLEKAATGWKAVARRYEDALAILNSVKNEKAASQHHAVRHAA